MADQTQSAPTHPTLNLDVPQPTVQLPNKTNGSQLIGVPAAVAGDSVGGGGGAPSSALPAEVKRKRGRPPRVQAKPPPAKKQLNVEEDEDVCFICFDGGSLVLCDRRGCPKAYHTTCIKRDEAFFKSKAKWNCGWHICSVCQKSSHYMCYTCTYSLCKGCTKGADYLRVRGNKGLCMTCMKVIRLIENMEQGNKEMEAQVDFDDQGSWEYLFKVYWLCLKEQLCLTLEELSEAKNPSSESDIIAFKAQPPAVPLGINDVKSSIPNMYSGNLEGSNSIKGQSNEAINKVSEDSLSIEKTCNKRSTINGSTKWASKELLDFVTYMKNGDTTVMSQFDVQALLLDYVNRNNLRDPHQKSHILCDLILKTLFGKQHLSHSEMLRLLEFHFLLKEEPSKDLFIQGGAVGIDVVQVMADENSNNLMDKEEICKARNKGEENRKQCNLNDYAAIDVHNINLIYLRRNLMENLLEDKEKFHGNVIGSVVRIRTSDGEQKQDMYRLVQVVGTIKVHRPYKFGNTTADVMLEVFNLDKKEAVSVDSISNQDFSEAECSRLCQSIRCGLGRWVTVGEIQEKAMALQAVRLNNSLEAELLSLNHLRDPASENGREKELTECVEKIKLLKTLGEHQRRLCQIPEVHSDSSMVPHYESEEARETDRRKQGESVKHRHSGYNRDGNRAISQRNRGDFSGDTGSRASINSSPSCQDSKNSCATSYLEKEEGAAKALQRLREGIDACRFNKLERSGNEIDCNGLAVSGWNNQAVASSTSLSTIASEPSTACLSTTNTPLSAYNSETRLWHYRDPVGKTQGPFCMVELQQWSTTGYFPPNMRIWAGNRQDDSILLAAALNGKFHKLLPLLNYMSSQLQEVGGGASDSRSCNSDIGWKENIDATREGKQTGKNLCGSHSVIQPNSNNDLMRCDSQSGQSSVWKTTVVSSNKEAPAGSCSHDHNLFNGSRSRYNPLKVRRSLLASKLSSAELETHSHHDINHEVKRWNSDPDHENCNSLETTVDKCTGRDIFENKTYSQGVSTQSSVEKIFLNNFDLNSTLSMTKSTDSPDQNGEINTTDMHSPPQKTSNMDWEREATGNKEPASSNVHHSYIPVVPGSRPNAGNEYQKGQTVENKQDVSSNIAIQDSAPSWTGASSLVVGGPQLADLTDVWGEYSPTPVKRSLEQWDSICFLSLKQPERPHDHVSSAATTSGELSHFSLSHPPSCWQAAVSEPIEFSTLAEESVSDLLAEVDAMESQGGLPSPTSMMKCGDDLINLNMKVS